MKDELDFWRDDELPKRVFVKRQSQNDLKSLQFR